MILSRIDDQSGSPADQRRNRELSTPFSDKRRERGAKTLLLLLLAYALTYWLLFYAAIGLPSVGEFYLGLAAFLLLLRLGWPVLDYFLPQP
ncbi:MAG TPA: hypothetical protein VF098_07125 [Sphingomicrobium sp.]